MLEQWGEDAEAEPLYRQAAETSKRPGAVFDLALFLARHKRGKEALDLCEQAWRTGRPEDRIVSFKAYVVEDDSPPPGERTPTNPRSRQFFEYRE